MRLNWVVVVGLVAALSLGVWAGAALGDGMVVAAAGAAQLPATGIHTDVMQTSAGELQIKPLTAVTLLLSWAGESIYLDPIHAANFGGWPKADLIIVTEGDRLHFDPSAVASLRKAKTMIIAPADVAAKLAGSMVIPSGSTRTVTFPNVGKPQPMSVLGLAHAGNHGEGYVLGLGTTLLLFAGDTTCTPQIMAQRNIRVAFISLDPQQGMSSKAAAACVGHFRPKIVYPYRAQGNAAQFFEQTLGKGKGIEVRIRAW